MSHLEVSQSMLVISVKDREPEVSYMLVEWTVQHLVDSLLNLLYGHWPLSWLLRQCFAELKVARASNWKFLDESKHALTSMFQLVTRYVQPVACGCACMLGSLCSMRSNTSLSMNSKQYTILDSLFCNSVV